MPFYKLIYQYKNQKRSWGKSHACLAVLGTQRHWKSKIVFGTFFTITEETNVGYLHTPPLTSGTYQNDRVPHQGIFTDDSAVDILAELGRIVIHVCEVDADSSCSAEGWGAPIFSLHHQVKSFA
jgi:hypothetical protein